MAEKENPNAVLYIGSLILTWITNLGSMLATMVTRGVESGSPREPANVPFNDF